MEIDYTKFVDEALPQASNLAKTGDINFFVLSPHGNEQWDLLHRVHLIRQMQLIPEYNNLILKVIHVIIFDSYGNVLQKFSCSRYLEVIVADNHNNFNLTIFNRKGNMLNAMESKVKHAQCFDRALIHNGSVVLASSDYHLYRYSHPLTV